MPSHIQPFHSKRLHNNMDQPITVTSRQSRAFPEGLKRAAGHNVGDIGVFMHDNRPAMDGEAKNKQIRALLASVMPPALVCICNLAFCISCRLLCLAWAPSSSSTIGVGFLSADDDLLIFESKV
jgi:hypothetical protein